MKTATIVIIATAISISVGHMACIDVAIQCNDVIDDDVPYQSRSIIIICSNMDCWYAAMMFPAIIPMILVYNRLTGSNNTSHNSGNSNHNSQMIYHKSNDDHNENANNEILNPMKEGKR